MALRYRDYASPVHPMADFLTKQLPLMLQRHKQNRDDRIHEKEMAQFRLDNQKELAVHNADLNEKKQLKVMELQQLFGQLEEGKKLLKESDVKAEEFGIISANWHIAPKDATEGAVDVLKQMGNNMSQERNFAVTNYSNLESTKADVMSQLQEIQQAQGINNQILEGANVGARVAGLIKDADKNEELNELDIAAYFQTEDAIVKNLNDIQKIGFDKTFPTAVETFDKQLDRQYSKDLKKANIKKAKLKAEHGIKISPLLNLADRDINYSKRYDDGGLSKGLKEVWTTLPLTKMKSDRGAIKAIAEDPTLLFDKTLDFSNHLYKAIDYLEDESKGKEWFHVDWTATDNKIESWLESYSKAKLPEDKKNIMMAMSNYLIGTDCKKGEENFKALISGNERDKYEIWKLMEHFQDIYKEELMYNKPIPDPTFNPEADPGSLLTP